MKADLLILTTLTALLCWTHVESMSIPFFMDLMEVAENRSIELSLSEDSVDDMYLGCGDSMLNLVKDKYYEEKYATAYLHVAWANAEECAAEMVPQRKNEELTALHRVAMCMYTDDLIYDKFNAAVRTNKTEYGSTFKFHSMHFLLSDAVQMLNANAYCHTVYRRSHTRFTGQPNLVFRFGSFASASYGRNLTHFGTKTCFKIRTCSGAFLDLYSAAPGEAEVLIPPYEMFEVRKVVSDQDEIGDMGLEFCDSLFVVDSVGVKSDLNCKLMHN